MMQAVLQTAIGGADVLELAEIEVPSILRSTMLVRVDSVGVNFHDVEIRRRGEAGIQLPYVPGTDVVGRVEAMAADVTGFEVGQRVLALVRDGGYAEVVRVHAAMSVPVGEDVSDAVAASIPVPGLTAWFLCKDLVDDATGHVVVHAAAGSVGCWVPALLAGRPVRAIGIVSSSEKAEIARAAGYDEVVDRSVTADVVGAVLDATDRRGGDVVLDSVAGPAFGDSFRMARTSGTVVLFGRAAGPPALDDLAETFLDARRNLTLRTFFLRRTLLTRMAELQGGFATLLQVAASGELTMPITRLSLSDASRAHTLLESRASTGKLVLCPRRPEGG